MDGPRLLFIGAALLTPIACQDALAGTASVVANDTASMSLKMYGSFGSVVSINSGGDVPVLRSQPLVSIGNNINGTGQILAGWDEIVDSSPGHNQVLFVLKTSNGEDMFPADVKIGAEDFFVFSWIIGIPDRVSFKNGFTTLPLFSAKAELSDNGGPSGIFQTKPILTDHQTWDGTDDGVGQPLAGRGVNYIRLTYEIGQVPAPASLAMAGLGLIASGRRRTRR